MQALSAASPRQAPSPTAGTTPPITATPDATVWLYVAVEYFQNRCAKNDPPYLRQPKSNRLGSKDHLSKRDHVRHALKKQGVPIQDVPRQPTWQTPGLVSQSLHWLRDVARTASRSLPGWPALPDPSQWRPMAWPVAAAQTDPPYVLGQGGVAVATTHFDAARHEADEASTPEPYRLAIASVVGDNQTHQVPMPPRGLPGTPFLANVAIEGPGFVLFTNNEDNSTHVARLIRHTVNAAGKFLQSLSVPVEVLAFGANMANIDWAPAQGVFIVADMGTEQETRLWQVFENPPHLVSVDLDFHGAHSPNGESSCYDGDLAYRTLQTSRPGKPLFLVFEACVKDARYASPVTDLVSAFRAAYHALMHWLGQTFAQLMEDLGYVVIRVSPYDHAHLALNFVATGAEPGRIVFTRSDVSPGLVQQLIENGVTPEFPADGQQLGHIGTYPGKSAFGVKCTSFTLPKPVGASPLVPMRSPQDGPTPKKLET